MRPIKLLLLTIGICLAQTCQKSDYCPSTLCACNGACYSEDQYCCSNGQLTQKAFCETSTPTTSSGSSSSSCTPYTTMPLDTCDSSNPSRDNQCCVSDGVSLADGVYCGGRHQCSGGICVLTGASGFNCPVTTSSPAATTSVSSTTCQKSDYCSSSLCACNGACYSEDQYCCPNGQLTQKAFCSSSNSATSNSDSDSSANTPAQSTSASSNSNSDSSSTCHTVTIVALSSCADSNPTRDLECCIADGYGLADGDFCGTYHQCRNGYCGLTGQPGENCAYSETAIPTQTSSNTADSATTQTCQKADYCSSSLCACNGACYSEDQYCCPNGQLTQKAFCSSSNSGSSNSGSSNSGSAQQVSNAVVVNSSSTITLVNKCDVSIDLCSTYGGPLFTLAAGQSASNQPSGPYNECGYTQAEVTLGGYASLDYYDLTQVAYKDVNHKITVYTSSSGDVISCSSSNCADATQSGQSAKVHTVPEPASIFIQWC